MSNKSVDDLVDGVAASAAFDDARERHLDAHPLPGPSEAEILARAERLAARLQPSRPKIWPRVMAVAATALAASLVLTVTYDPEVELDATPAPAASKRAEVPAPEVVVSPLETQAPPPPAESPAEARWNRLPPRTIDMLTQLLEESE